MCMEQTVQIFFKEDAQIAKMVQTALITKTHNNTLVRDTQQKTLPTTLQLGRYVVKTKTENKS